MSLAAFLENLNIQPCIWFQGESKRNAVASLISGILFFIGWWIIIDVNVTAYDHFYGAYHLCGIFGTISLVMVNAVSNAALNGDYGGGCMSQQGVRIWLFMGFLTGFASIIAACWILFAEYVAKNTKENPIPQWPGSGLFLQNCFIFIASLVFKFGRTEETVW